jgi:hypothetical protein
MAPRFRNVPASQAITRSSPKSCRPDVSAARHAACTRSSASSRVRLWRRASARSRSYGTPLRVTPPRVRRFVGLSELERTRDGRREPGESTVSSLRRDPFNRPQPHGVHGQVHGRGSMVGACVVFASSLDCSTPQQRASTNGRPLWRRDSSPAPVRSVSSERRAPPRRSSVRTACSASAPEAAIDVDVGSLRPAIVLDVRHRAGK